MAINSNIIRPKDYAFLPWLIFLKVRCSYLDHVILAGRRSHLQKRIRKNILCRGQNITPHCAISIQPAITQHSLHDSHMEELIRRTPQIPYDRALR